MGGQELGFDGTTTVQTLDGDWLGSDGIPGFAFLDLDMDPIVEGAGGRLVLRERGARLTAVTRANSRPFANFRDEGLPEYDGPKPQPLAAGANEGRGWIELPDRAGTWVIEFLPEWQTECYQGNGINWVVVETR